MFDILIFGPDSKNLKEAFEKTLDRDIFTVKDTEPSDDLIKKLTIASCSLLVLSGLEGRRALEILKAIKKNDPRIVVLIAAEASNVKDAVEAIREGAYHYVIKPLSEVDISRIVKGAYEAYSLKKRVMLSAPRLKVDEKLEITSDNDSMMRIFSIIDKLAIVDTSVLIRGENGTGKELVAKAIHSNSLRKDGPFVAVNCGAIPENLIESEFFGHERGAFTDAEKRVLGKIQYAGGGTLFLDEIGELPLSMQAKLLRVLQEKTFTPVGANHELHADIRIVAATNRDLEKMIKECTFREDLFYRLNVLPVYLPPLRDRIEDIPILVDQCVRKFNKEQGKAIKKIETAAHELLRNYSWPGNIRELENVIELAFVLETGDIIKKESLPAHIQKLSMVKSDNIKLMDYEQDKEKFEKDFIIMVLKKFKGKINKTIEHANIPKNTLLRKLKKYGINPKDYEK